MHKSKFIKHLKQLGEEELREELTMLYDKVADVKKFYAMEIGTAEQRQKTYTKAKKEIEAKYKTKSYRRPRRPRIQKIKKILSEIQKLSVFSHELIDVFLFDVECALNFASEYNYFSTPLFNNIIRSYSVALRFISENQLELEYKERCANVMAKSIPVYELNREIVTLFNEVFNKGNG